MNLQETITQQYTLFQYSSKTYFYFRNTRLNAIYRFRKFKVVDFADALCTKYCMLQENENVDLSSRWVSFIEYVISISCPRSI